MANLSERLASLRKQHNYTQKDIGKVFGVSATSWQRFEYGTSRPKLANVIAIADKFGVSVDYLLGRTDNPAINH